MRVVIAHPVWDHRPGDVVDVPDPEGRALIGAGFARRPTEEDAPPPRKRTKAKRKPSKTKRDPDADAVETSDAADAALDESPPDDVLEAEAADAAEPST